MSAPTIPTPPVIPPPPLPPPVPPKPQRRRRNSSKVNLVISAVFHTVIIVALFFFAAREGMLGKKMKTLAAVMVREKPPEKPKEKPPEPKVETPKETPKVAAAKPNLPPPTAAAPLPPAAVAAPAVAPPPAVLQAFDFSDGAKQVITTTNVVEIYSEQIQYAFRSRWARPDMAGDEAFSAEVQVQIDATGKVLATQWKRGSGNAKWDDSVRAAVRQTASINQKPPKDFPSTFMVRFDVASETVDPAAAGPGQ